MISLPSTTTVSAAMTTRPGSTSDFTASALFRAICTGTSMVASPAGQFSGVSFTRISKSTSAHSSNCLRRGEPDAKTIRSILISGLDDQQHGADPRQHDPFDDIAQQMILFLGL